MKIDLHPNNVEAKGEALRILNRIISNGSKDSVFSNSGQLDDVIHAMIRFAQFVREK